MHARSTAHHVGETTHGDEPEDDAPRRAGAIKLHLAPQERDPEAQENDRQRVAPDAQHVRERTSDGVSERSEGVQVREGDEEPDDDESNDQQVTLVTLPDVGLARAAAFARERGAAFLTGFFWCFACTTTT